MYRVIWQGYTQGKDMYYTSLESLGFEVLYELNYISVGLLIPEIPLIILKNHFSKIPQNCSCQKLIPKTGTIAHFYRYHYVLKSLLWLEMD